MELIKVGISACLMGEEVRYNGGHKKNGRLIAALASRFQLVPVCPEVEMGLGTPREPMGLFRVGPSVRMITVDSRIDHTDGMQAWSARRLEELAAEDISGFVLKKDSPSCGLRVTVHDPPSPEAEAGLFADALLRRFPDLPVAEETDLENPGAVHEFVERVVAYSRTALAPRRSVRVLRVTDAGALERPDLIAVEEPLEVRLHDRPFAVIMRTPGADRQLAAGFLLAEGVITHADDLGAVEHCRHPDQPGVHNVVNVFLVGGAAKALPEKLEGRRNVLANSSCGICGRVTIESLRTRAVRLPATIVMDRAAIQALPEGLRARQPLFEQTGALHAAAIFTADGACVATAEDVGRHNAVDKVIGEMLLASRLPLTGHALAVSGRTSYEIVQKAWLAGIEIVCAVSAPSSLAIELADQAGITLIGFARPEGFNVYSCPARLRM